MTVVIIYVIFSFLLDSILSLYTPSTLGYLSYFKTIYSLISLIIIYNYFQSHKNYLIILLILGVLFDVVYTNTFLVNVIIFIIIYLLLQKLDYIIPNNLFTINIKALLSIYSYHIITYIILLIANYNSYSFKVLGDILLKNTPMTIIYTTISYLIFKKIYYQKYDRKIK